MVHSYQKYHLRKSSEPKYKTFSRCPFSWMLTSKLKISFPSLIFCSMILKTLLYVVWFHQNDHSILYNNHNFIFVQMVSMKRGELKCVPTADGISGMGHGYIQVAASQLPLLYYISGLSKGGAEGLQPPPPPNVYEIL